MSKVKNWKHTDLVEYANNMASDGNWSFEMALTCRHFIEDMYKRKLKRRRESFWQDNKNLVFNLEAYPEMDIDIKTGKVLVLEDD